MSSNWNTRVGISINIGIEIQQLKSISIVSESNIHNCMVSVSYRYRKKWYQRPLLYCKFLNFLRNVSTANKPQLKFSVTRAVRYHKSCWIFEFFPYCLTLCQKFHLKSFFKLSKAKWPKLDFHGKKSMSFGAVRKPWSQAGHFEKLKISKKAQAIIRKLNIVKRLHKSGQCCTVWTQ